MAAEDDPERARAREFTEHMMGTLTADGVPPLCCALNEVAGGVAAVIAASMVAVPPDLVTVRACQALTRSLIRMAASVESNGLGLIHHGGEHPG